MFLFIQGPPKSLVVGIVSDFYISKTKRRLHDRKTEHFKSLTNNDHSSAFADHVTVTGHSNIKWDHFEILASGKTARFINVKHQQWKADALLAVAFWIQYC